jgi:hypothetical protein
MPRTAQESHAAEAATGGVCRDERALPKSLLEAVDRSKPKAARLCRLFRRAAPQTRSHRPPRLHPAHQDLPIKKDTAHAEFLPVG